MDTSEISLRKIGTLALFIILIAVIIYFSLSETKEPTTQSIEKPIATDSSKDEDAYKAAMEAKDITVCDSISDQAQKETCKETLTNVLTYEEAVNSMDLTKCDELTDQRIVDSCKSAVSDVIELKTK